MSFSRDERDLKLEKKVDFTSNDEPFAWFIGDDGDIESRSGVKDLEVNQIQKEE